MDGILLINKEVNVTSRDVDNKLQKILNTKSIGHLGTLDPFASGLLVVGVNQGTKLFQFMEDYHKTYIATLKLGEKTDTGDLTGEVIEKKNVYLPNKDTLEYILLNLIGKSMQVPPMYSAKHINGKRAYELAREGKSFKNTACEIEIFNLNLINYDKNSNEITFIVETSKGTYIRTLGETIAEKLNTVGHLTYLQRVKIGDFSIEKATLVNATSIDNIIPLNNVLPFKKILVDESNYKLIKNGAKITLNKTFDNYIQFVSTEDKLIAIYAKDKDFSFKCIRGFK